MANYHYEGYYHDENSGDERNSRISGGHQNRSLMKMKSFDAVVFDLLKVTPEMFAQQLTLLDFPIFCQIRPEEITSCGWTKKEKHKLSPNVIAMTRRFNHTSFWVIREILNASTLKIRAERLIHFIRIAKKLVELNNLHSLMAVVQSLTSSSIFRLSQTWALIPKHHKTTFDRMHSLVKEDDNRRCLRSHMSTIQIPCIPYLGMYLSDVMYINSAHPDTGGLESHERANKMNNILRVISEFQKSDYRHLQEISHIKNYLNSVKYIEELQRFLEEDNYKLSLKIEPVSTPHADGSQKKDETVFARGLNKTDKYQTSPLQHKFVPGHRKSRSLGKEFYCGHTTNKNRNDTNVKIQKRQSLGGKQTKVKTWSSPSHQSKTTENHHHQHHTRHPKSISPNLSSGSLPRSTLAPPAVSLLDDSILHNNSPLAASTSSATNKTSATGVCNNVTSMGSSRSNSGSEFSEHDDSLTWIPDRLHKVSFFRRRRKQRRQQSRFWKPKLRWTKTSRDDKHYQQYISANTPPARKCSCTSELSKTAPPAARTKSTTSLTSVLIDEFVRHRCHAASTSTVAVHPTTSPHPRTSFLNSGFGDGDDDEEDDDDYDTVSSREGTFKRLNESRSSTFSCNSSLTQITPRNNHYQRKVGTAPGGMMRYKRWTDEDEVAAAAEGVDHSSNATSCQFEGLLKRKCVLKKGRRPSMNPWTRYWVSLRRGQLLLHSSKSLGSGHERHHFKTTPSKILPIIGWMVLSHSDRSKPDSFQLSNPENGTIYRFHCDSVDVADVWVANLKEGVKENPKPEKDLIDLGDR